MSPITGSRHLGDEDLIRYIDHQLDREGMRLLGAHLRTCGECTQRLDDYRRKSAAVSEWLALVPAEMPDPNKRAVALAALDRARFRRRSLPAADAGWLKVAATVVLLLGVGLATEPGRAFVAHGIVGVAGSDPGPFATRLVEWLGQEKQLAPRLAVAPQQPHDAVAPIPAPATEAAPATAPAPPAHHAARPVIKPGMSAPVRFTPPGPDVTLTFSNVQQVGAATVWIRNVGEGNGQAVTHYHGEEIAASPTGLEVRNRPDSHADYVITVPARFRFVRVKVGDSPEVLIRITKAKQEWIWTINLQTSALQ